MPDEPPDVLLKADGGHLLLASGGKIILAQTVGGRGGGSPVEHTRTTQKGVSIFDQDPVRGVHARKIFKAKPLGQAEAQLIFKSKNLAEGLILIPTKIRTDAIIQPKQKAGISLGRLLFTEKNRNYTRLKFEYKHKALAYMHEHYAKKPEYTKPLLEGFIKVIEKMNKLSEIDIYTKMLESLERDDLKKNVKSLEFSFEESTSEWNFLIKTEQIPSQKVIKIWKELSPAQRKKLLKEMNLNPDLAKADFNDLPDNVKKTFTKTDRTGLLVVLGLVAGATLLGLFNNILDAPAGQPIAQIKKMPVEPKKPKPPRMDRRPREPTFQAPSSFVGRVTYTPDFQTMEIRLPGMVYGFCGVPERIFDSFKGASSKGAFFNRNIKGQFNC